MVKEVSFEELVGVSKEKRSKTRALQSESILWAEV